MFDAISMRRHTGGRACRNITFSVWIVFTCGAIVPQTKCYEMSRPPRDISVQAPLHGIRDRRSTTSLSTALLTSPPRMRASFGRR